MHSRSSRAVPILACAGFALSMGLSACRSSYYTAMEWFGEEKRDILSTRVADAREDQVEAKEQFESALERLGKIVALEDTDLKRAYERAQDDLEASDSKAEDVRERVEAVETVGRDLFSEWEDEIRQYSRDDLRDKSRATMRDTRAKYDDMLGAMKRASKSMDPVLAAFRDQVLFLKHNLNAQAVGSLKGAVTSLEKDVAALIGDMEKSIAEADRFIQGLQ
ncbi:MAG: DUF2959 domain-containing protein [Planctomycetota bacterium]